MFFSVNLVVKKCPLNKSDMKIYSAVCIPLMLLFVLSECKPKKTSDHNQSIPQVTSGVPSYRLEQIWATDTVFKTPESVIYDQARKVVYVSNVNQNPWEKDGNGFISKISKSGDILELNWVSGLSGPKGMAIFGNILYVADIDELISIDTETGEIKNKIEIEGASGLNDITPGKNGKIYVSDSNEGKIFQYDNAKISNFISDIPFRPNGLLVDQGQLLVAFSKSGEFIGYNISSLDKTLITKQIGAGDGITATNKSGTYLVSDWNGEIFILGKDIGKQSLLNTKNEKKNTADIWFILEENLLLVPTFYDNRVVAYRLIRE